MSNIKNEALGMSHGTAANRLRKNILFALVCQLNLNICYRCGEKFYTVSEFSIEHRQPWLSADNPKEAFFDLGNIAFSHLKCNSLAGSRWKPGRNITRSDAELKAMKKQWPSRTPAARRVEYAKSKNS